MDRVVAAVDLSQYTKACIAYGFYFAKKFNLPLYLLYVIRPVEIPIELGDFETIIERFVSHAQEQAEKQLKAYKEEMESKGVDTHIVARVGHPVEEILDFIDETPTLSIVAPHDGGFLRSLIGGVTEKIARKSPYPVAVVKSEKPPNIGEVKIEKILVPVDFSEDSRKALFFALDTTYKENIKIIHVFKREVIKSLLAKLEGHHEILEKWKEEASAKLKEWEDAYGVEGILKEGEPSIAILEEAYNMRADAIYMGARGLKSKKILMGRLTEKIIKSSTIPVLILR